MQYIINNVGHCTDDEFEVNGEEPAAKRKATKGIPLLSVLWMSIRRKELAGSVSRATGIGW